MNANVTPHDFHRLEGKVDKLADAIEKLILIEDRQARHAERLEVVENKAEATAERLRAVERRLDKAAAYLAGMVAVGVFIFEGAKFLQRL